MTDWITAYLILAVILAVKYWFNKVTNAVENHEALNSPMRKKR